MYCAHILAFFLPVLPLLGLLIALLLGRYPGHRAIVRLVEKIEARGRRHSTVSGATRRRLRLGAVSGGQLLARSLSGRAPPAAVGA